MKVMMDGFNLSLAQGTGIATYARKSDLSISNLSVMRCMYFMAFIARRIDPQ